MQWWVRKPGVTLGFDAISIIVTVPKPYLACWPISNCQHLKLFTWRLSVSTDPIVLVWRAVQESWAVNLPTLCLIRGHSPQPVIDKSWWITLRPLSLHYFPEFHGAIMLLLPSGVTGFVTNSFDLLSLLELYPFSPTSASWDLLPNKLLAFQSLSQICLGENSHPLQKSLLGFCRTSCHFFDFCSFSRTIIGKSRRCLAPPMPKIGAQQPRSHFSCSCRSPPLFLEGYLGLDQCCKHRATQ